MNISDKERIIALERENEKLRNERDSAQMKIAELMKQINKIKVKIHLYELTLFSPVLYRL